MKQKELNSTKIKMDLCVVGVLLFVKFVFALVAPLDAADFVVVVLALALQL